MQPFALPRARSRVRHLAIRTHFHNPRARVAATVKPFKPDYAAMFVAVAVGAQIVFAVAVWVVS